MATNNRLVDYNSSLIQQDSRINNIVDFLGSQSVIKYHTPTIFECYKTVPMSYRDSDILFIAGSWKVGAVVGFDRSNNPIDAPFQRLSTAWSMRDIEMYQDAINEPSIDDFFLHRSKGLQFCKNIFNTSVLRFSTYRSLNGSVLAPTSNTIKRNGLNKLQQLNGGIYSNIEYTAVNSTTAGTYRVSLWIDLTNFPIGYTATFYPVNTSRSTYIRYNYNGVEDYNLTTASRLEHFTVDAGGSRMLYLGGIAYSNVGANSSVTSVQKRNEPTFIGDESVFLRVGWLRYVNINDSVQDTPYLYDNNWDNAATRQTDSLTINLLNNADIAIATSTRFYEIKNQPAGDFKVHEIPDFQDCKIYSIAVKYI